MSKVFKFSSPPTSPIGATWANGKPSASNAANAAAADTTSSFTPSPRMKHLSSSFRAIPKTFEGNRALWTKYDDPTDLEFEVLASKAEYIRQLEQKALEEETERKKKEIEAKLARESAQRRLKYLKAYEKEHRGPPINYAEVMRERELLKAEALKREEEFQSNLKAARKHRLLELKEHKARKDEAYRRQMSQLEEALGGVRSVINPSSGGSVASTESFPFSPINNGSIAQESPHALSSRRSIDSLSSTASNYPTYYPEGAEVVHIPSGSKGTVRFCGRCHLGGGMWVGLELQEPTGSHDGERDGIRYFQTKPRQGLLAKISQVRPAEAIEEGRRRSQSLKRLVKNAKSSGYGKLHPLASALKFKPARSSSMSRLPSQQPPARKPRPSSATSAYRASSAGRRRKTKKRPGSAQPSRANGKPVIVRKKKSGTDQPAAAGRSTSLPRQLQLRTRASGGELLRGQQMDGSTATKARSPQGKGSPKKAPWSSTTWKVPHMPKEQRELDNVMNDPRYKIWDRSNPHPLHRNAATNLVKGWFIRATHKILTKAKYAGSRAKRRPQVVTGAVTRIQRRSPETTRSVIPAVPTAAASEEKEDTVEASTAKVSPIKLREARNVVDHDASDPHTSQLSAGSEGDVSFDISDLDFLLPEEPKSPSNVLEWGE